MCSDFDNEVPMSKQYQPSALFLIPSKPLPSTCLSHAQGDDIPNNEGRLGVIRSDDLPSTAGSFPLDEGVATEGLLEYELEVDEL